MLRSLAVSTAEPVSDDSPATLDALARERLSTLGFLAAELNHELRNQLFVLSSAIDELAEQSKGELHEKIVTMRHCHDRLHNLSEAMRHLVRGRTLAAKGRCDAISVARTLITVMQRFAQVRGATIFVEAPKEQLEVPLRAFALEQALLNLVLNALTAVEMSERREIHVSLASEDGDVRVRVIDTGPGLERDRARALFDAPRSDRDDGTGIGLQVVRQIAESGGGSVSAFAGEAGGLVVEMRLPRLRRV